MFYCNSTGLIIGISVLVSFQKNSFSERSAGSGIASDAVPRGGSVIRCCALTAPSAPFSPYSPMMTLPVTAVFS